MYVAVKGGEAAIDNAHRLMAEERRGAADVPELSLAQIESQMSLAVDRVMNEGSVYDRELAALAIKQAQGDLVEAIFLLRAFRSTLPRLGQSLPVDTAEMEVRRRISGTFKDVPGGQILGPTYDYTHRLLDFALAAGGNPPQGLSAAAPVDRILPRVTDVLGRDGLIEAEPQGAGDPPGDITRDPPAFPAARDVRLQNLARADEGFLLAMAYSSQRGYGHTHPFAGEIRMGEVTLSYELPELGFAVEIGEVTVTECQMINQFKGTGDVPPQFTRGYGLVFGRSERKAMAMALVDRSLRAQELGEMVEAPAQDAEFVLAHSDNVEASGFVQHLKLPHYVDFQSELELIRRLRAKAGSAEPQQQMAAE
jgi:alpha-D-ribose 1-methylphosphonate 5-triphosphate synthase subunit PhnI